MASICFIFTTVMLVAACSASLMPLNSPIIKRQFSPEFNFENLKPFYNKPGQHPSIPHPLFRHMRPAQDDACDPGEPLMLTPYIDSNRTDEGRLAAAVKNLPGADESIHSYSGFITVNATENSNMFFWLFETTNSTAQKPEDKPLMIWLQGGPGGSSLFGLFVELGPYGVDEHMQLYRRTNFSWSDIGNLLFIENPVGTGFSFTGSKAGYSTDETQVAWNLYNFLQQFYQLFPNYLRTDLYLTGESYAGKYLPALAFRIHEQNTKTNEVKIPLTGVAIGDGWCDPQNMLEALGPMLYNFGMADENEAEYINEQTAKFKAFAETEKWPEALDIVTHILMSDDPPSYFVNITGSTNVYNLLMSSIPSFEGYYLNYLQSCDVRREIHVGTTPYGGNTSDVIYSLRHDFVDTIREWLPTVFDNYRVLMYSGQLDIIVGVALTENFLDRLEGWTWRDEYLNAQKVVWKDSANDTEVAGYVKTARNNQFYYAVVRGAGHMVPTDQPQRAFDLLSRFVNNQTYN